MQKSEFLSRLDTYITRVRECYGVATDEYATPVDVFENFNQDAHDLQIDRTIVWRIFAGKHWRGITSFLRSGKMQREDVRGRIMDLIVYLFLLWGMLDEKEELTRKEKMLADREAQLQSGTSKL